MRVLHFLPLLSVLTLVTAQNDPIKCGKKENKKCPETAPCCSEYDTCGTSAVHCGGGCYSDWSFNSKKEDKASCFADRPGREKKCVSGYYEFKDDTWVINESAYNGDINSADWTVNYVNSSNIQFGKDGGVRIFLTAPPTRNDQTAGQGTRFSTTAYMTYGTFSARLKVPDQGGIVTALISMSEERDEIDWEITGENTKIGQSNYFLKGVVDHSKGGKHEFSGGQDLAAGYHDYGIKWTKDSIEWIADGRSVRTVERRNGQDWPSTPSRIQFSVWDGGAAGGGTRSWAGGAVDWRKQLAYPATFLSATIQCEGDPLPTGPPKRQPGYKPPNVILPEITMSVAGMAGYQEAAMKKDASSSGGQALLPSSAGREQKVEKVVGAAAVCAAVGLFLAA